MTSSLLRKILPAIAPAASHLPAAARAVAAMLEKMTVGSLSLQWPDGRIVHYGAARAADGGAGQPSAVMHLHDWRVCGRVLRAGDIGLAEAYFDKEWSTPHLTDLIGLFVANRHSLERAIHGHWAGGLMYRLRHWLRRNTRANSRKNIHAHYDLGNGFYRLWLDETMNYSSAWFDQGPNQDLVTAQIAKMRRTLRMAGVQPGHRVLEIGCGWGALAEEATCEFGAHVTGVTLSTEQLEYAQARLRSLGVGDRADLRLQDYRDIADAPFDAICSIEMVEAVGQQYWPAYFETVHRLLKSGGRACIQSIVIGDDLFEQYSRSTDFIQQYIFPGGCLPSPRAFREQARAAGLTIVDEFAFGPDYAITCQRWREAFRQKKAQVMQAGFDERFTLIWDFYLSYCEAGFAMGDINVVQFTLQKP